MSLSIDDWFDLMDTSYGEGVGGVVTECELKLGLAKMKFPANFRKFSQSEIVELVRYLDPTGEGDMTIDEVRDAFRDVDCESAADQLRGDVGLSLQRLEKFMKDKGMRMIDLISHFSGIEKGEGSDGSMTTVDLKNGLAALVAPSASLQILVSRKQAAIADKAAKDLASKEEEKVLNAKIKVLEDSGTGKVMRAIFEIMREKGLKLGTVFSEIDKTGDGVIDASELRWGLEKLTKTSDVSAYALEKAKEKNVELERLESIEREKREKFFSKMQAAKDSGVMALMDKISGVMRSRQMRIKDLYALKFAGSKSKFAKSKKMRKGKVVEIGNGEAVEEEKKVESGGGEGGDSHSIDKFDLMEMMEKADKKSKITEEESDMVCNFIDESGDGSLSLDELEKSINEYRRYLWDMEKENQRQLFKEAAAAPPLFTRREVLMCVKALDATGEMDGKISVEDLEEGLRRARDGGEEFGSIFGKSIEEGVEREAGGGDWDGDGGRDGDGWREGKGKGEGKPSVGIVVPREENSEHFHERYKVVVAENEQATGENESLFTSAVEIGGEVLMVRFSDDANGMSVTAFGQHGGEVKCGGFFSPKKLRGGGVKGDWGGGGEKVKVAMCKDVSKRLRMSEGGGALELAKNIM